MADTTISADGGRRASWRFVLQHPAHLVAFGLGVGLVPGAPGTAGTLLAFPLYWALAPRIGPHAFLAVIAVLFLIGMWASEHTGRALGRADHGGIVCDEVVAFLLVLFFTPAHPLWQAGAFLLFRVFDILKPPPIRYFDRTIGGGFGVMFDDLLAAFYALIVLAIARIATGS
ncbi:MAG: phosphatidylglycerophosphatase A family protein [Betaproteobacteria bacterium]